MRIASRFFLGVLFVVTVGFALTLNWALDDLEPEYRKATEEPLVDASRILAALASTTARGGKVDVEAFRAAFDRAREQDLAADIYGFTKRSVDFRVYITDAGGSVLFDSHEPGNVGRDFSRWNDVLRTLRGGYGARTTRADPDDPASSVMFVASPIVIRGKTAGVLSLGKPVTAANLFVSQAKRRMIFAGIVVALSVLLVVGLVSGMVARPIRRLTGYARAVRDGKRPPPPRPGGGETGELGKAFAEMQEALEGKAYVEEYVQRLTHEIKSPLSTIRGAAELLREEMPPEQRLRFLENILSETRRMQEVVEKLLLLASLEKRRDLPEVAEISLRSLLMDLRESLLPQLEKRGIALDIIPCVGSRVAPGVAPGVECSFVGDPFLVRQAVQNLLQNAVDFSPAGGRITVDVSYPPAGGVVLTVRDQGEGVPPYALPRVFERFYSLARPDTGKKSSGLGLALVREVALLHGGAAELVNAPGGGAIATISFPSRPPRV